MPEEIKSIVAAFSDEGRFPTGIQYAEAVNYLMRNRREKPIQRGRGDVPVIPGVYALFHKEELVYIGQSYNLAARIKSHVGNKARSSEAYKDFDSYAYLPVPEGSLDVVERRLIRKLQPPLNGKTQRRSWGWVLVDDLAETLRIQPQFILDALVTYEIARPFNGRSIELLDILTALGKMGICKNFSVNR